MDYDKNKEGKCEHQNKVEVGKDSFILCKLREPFIVRCNTVLCHEISITKRITKRITNEEDVLQ